jgi:hypothetical protein
VGGATFDVDGHASVAFEVELRRGTVQKLGGKHKDQWQEVELTLGVSGLLYGSVGSERGKSQTMCEVGA